MTFWVEVRNGHKRTSRVHKASGRWLKRLKRLDAAFGPRPRLATRLRKRGKP